MDTECEGWNFSNNGYVCYLQKGVTGIIRGHGWMYHVRGAPKSGKVADLQNGLQSLKAGVTNDIFCSVKTTKQRCRTGCCTNLLFVLLPACTSGAPLWLPYLVISRCLCINIYFRYTCLTIAILFYCH